MKVTEKRLKLNFIVIIMMVCISCAGSRGVIMASISKNDDMNDNKAHVIASFYKKWEENPIQEVELSVKNSMEEVFTYESLEDENTIELLLEPGTYRFKGSDKYSSYSNLSIKDVSVARGDTLKLKFYMTWRWR